MKHHLIPTLRLAALAGITLVTPALAVVNIHYVPVGNPNGDGIPDPFFEGNTIGVDYVYQIGKYEVTNAQYAEFLNAADPAGANANGVYNGNMGSDARGGIAYTSSAASGAKYTIRSSMGDKPVNYVSWYDAARFANWLHNGQGSGSTETGAYSLTLNTGIILKNVDATVWLPSDQEWKKAAYFDPTRGYWFYATQSDTIPTVASANALGGVSNPGGNVVNYDNGADWNAQNGNVTTVGSAGASSFYGTFDQGGNVAEWTDRVLVGDEVIVHGTLRGATGGSWKNDLYAMMSNNFAYPVDEFDFVGFRVAANVPEPTSLVLTMFAGGAMLLRRKRFH